MNYGHFKYACRLACLDSYDHADVDNENAQAIIRQDESYTYVTFRGSDERLDFMDDIDIRKFGFDRFEVHNGFFNHLDLVFEDVLDQVDLESNIVVSGHSLGAACAMLFAWMLVRLGYDVRRVIVLGGPRVGTAKWARDYSKRLGGQTVRVIRAGDAVAKVPPPMVTGYRHPDTKLVYIDDDDVVENASLLHQVGRDIWQWIQTKGRLKSDIEGAHSRHDYYSDVKDLEAQIVPVVFG